VAHVDAVRLQCGADILLMLQWDNPSEAGNLPGKLFEYLGARRPVLALGYDGGEMARIIRERGAGLFANDPQEIARQLRGWIETKRRADYVAALPESATAGYTRQEQYQQLLPILYQATHDLGSSRIR
jgi:glycosyltransferase involved in cell wall biosynthesis